MAQNGIVVVVVVGDGGHCGVKDGNEGEDEEDRSSYQCYCNAAAAVVDVVAEERGGGGGDGTPAGPFVVVVVEVVVG